jgi:hypothetical protein
MNAYAMNLDKIARKNDADSLFTVTVVRDLLYCLQNIELMGSAECKAQCNNQNTKTRNQCNEKINRFCALSLKNMLTSEVCQAFCDDATSGVKMNEPSCRNALQTLCKNATPSERVEYGKDCACFFDSEYYTPMLKKTFPSSLFQTEQSAVSNLSPVCWFPDCAKQAVNWKKPKDASCAISAMQPFSECLKVQISKNFANLDAYKNNLITECIDGHVHSGGCNDYASLYASTATNRPSSYVAIIVCLLVLLCGLWLAAYSG